jgi:hypothetical protein
VATRGVGVAVGGRIGVAGLDGFGGESPLYPRRQLPGSPTERALSVLFIFEPVCESSGRACIEFDRRRDVDRAVAPDGYLQVHVLYSDNVGSRVGRFSGGVKCNGSDNAEYGEYDEIGLECLAIHGAFSG